MSVNYFDDDDDDDDNGNSNNDNNNNNNNNFFDNNNINVCNNVSYDGNDYIVIINDRSHSLSRELQQNRLLVGLNHFLVFFFCIYWCTF